MKKHLNFYFIVLFLSAIQSFSYAEIRMPRIFSNGMVLQRDKPISIWGWALPDEEVHVSLGNHTKTVITNKQGRWLIKLDPMSAGGPFDLIINGKNSLTFTNVLLGDVWVCGGQSNMQWTVKPTGFKEADTGFLKNNRVRLFTVYTQMDYRPQNDLTGRGWEELTESTLDNFSAVAYHFGKKLYQDLQVPIGLISDNLGASSVETWMSNESLQEFPVFKAEMAETFDTGKSFKELNADFENYKKDWYAKDYFRGQGAREKWYLPETDFSSWKPINLLGNTWENEPDLKDFDGAVWVKTTFNVDKATIKDSLLLQLLQIDDYDITWVNGVKVGETFGRHNHRNYKVPASILKEKDNVLVVRIFDVGGIGGFTTSPFWANPLIKGQWVYKKGSSIKAEKFIKPILPNATPFSSPSVLFNANIAPLRYFSIRGVIWYQGEANAERAQEYRALFPAMIKSWRKNWNDADLPFLFVQLANYMDEKPEPSESSWAEQREAQASALNLPNTAMATAIDIGEAGDIHPKNKEAVGQRLAVAALKLVYNQDIVASGPVFDHMSISGNEVTISYKNGTNDLVSKDSQGQIRGFQVAGEDQKFEWAKARIEGNKVVLSSEKVAKPVAVRYAWSNNPGALQLYNTADLPALPFRTDQWKGVTDGNKFLSGPRF